MLYRIYSNKTDTAFILYYDIWIWNKTPARSDFDVYGFTIDMVMYMGCVLIIAHFVNLGDTCVFASVIFFRFEASYYQALRQIAVYVYVCLLQYLCDLWRNLVYWPSSFIIYHFVFANQLALLDSVLISSTLYNAAL